MRYLALAFIIAMLSACNGSDTDPTDVDTAGVTAAQMQSAITAAVSSATHAQAAQITSLQNQLKKVEQFGHAPGAPTTAHSYGVRTLAMLTEPVVTAATSFGPCADMGQHIADNTSFGDPLGATVEYFKQCPINGAQYVYGAVVETGAIATPPNNIVWFVLPGCAGLPIIFENDGSYNRPSLQGGVVFVSPVDNITQLMVTAGQTGISMTSASAQQGTSCFPDPETHLGYNTMPNVLSTTGVPTSVPANFIL